MWSPWSKSCGPGQKPVSKISKQEETEWETSSHWLNNLKNKYSLKYRTFSFLMLLSIKKDHYYLLFKETIFEMFISHFCFFHLFIRHSCSKYEKNKKYPLHLSLFSSLMMSSV